MPALREAVDDLDASLDALVAESLHPQLPDSPAVASLRALIDLEVWRTLRDQGARRRRPSSRSARWWSAGSRDTRRADDPPSPSYPI